MPRSLAFVALLAACGSTPPDPQPDPPLAPPVARVIAAPPPSPTRLEARPETTAPVIATPPPPLTFPPAETTCALDSDCVRAPKLDGNCCPMCAQYVAANHAWAARRDALCASRDVACAISCLEGRPPSVHCVAGQCVLRAHR